MRPFVLFSGDRLGHAAVCHYSFEVVERFIGSCQSREAWGAAPACLMWCIWQERNQRTFEGVELSLPNLKFLFFNSLHDWCSVSPFSVASFMDFFGALCVIG